MLVMEIDALISAINHVAYFPAVNPGHVRRYCKFSVSNGGRVTLSVYGDGDVWIHHYINNTQSMDGLEIILGDLDPIKKLKATYCSIRQSSTGAELISFNTFNSRKKPIVLDKITLGVYPGTLDAFPKYESVTNLITTVRSSTFRRIINTVDETSEHKDKNNLRLVKLTTSPFGIYSNARTADYLRFYIYDTQAVEEEEDSKRAENSYYLLGKYLHLISKVTESSEDGDVEIHHAEGPDDDRLVFKGPLGEVSVPLESGFSRDLAERTFNKVHLFEEQSVSIITHKTINISRLSNALQVLNPTSAAHSSMYMEANEEDINSLVLYFAGDIYQNNVSILPLNLDHCDLTTQWPLTVIDYEALTILAKLATRLDNADKKSDRLSLILGLYKHGRTRSRRNTRDHDFVLKVELSGRTGYKIILPVKSKYGEELQATEAIQ